MIIAVIFSLAINIGLIVLCAFFASMYFIAAKGAEDAHAAFMQMRDLYDERIGRVQVPSWVNGKRRPSAYSKPMIVSCDYDGPGIYVIRCQTRYKIGQSGNVAKRVRSYGTAIPFEWNVYTVIATKHPEALEAHLHERLAPYRVQGEWFDFQDDMSTLDALLDEIRAEV